MEKRAARRHFEFTVFAGKRREGSTYQRGEDDKNECVKKATRRAARQADYHSGNSAVRRVSRVGPPTAVRYDIDGEPNGPERIVPRINGAFIWTRDARVVGIAK